MGRNPKPTAVLQAEKGTLYSDQRDRAPLEPKPEREMLPRCPKRFSPEERRVWKNIAAVLKNYGLFSAANAIHLELLATAWVQYLWVSDSLVTVAKGKLILPNGKGGVEENPMLRTLQRLRAEVSDLCGKLGLSSIALARIGSLQLKAKQERDDFFD